MKKFDIFKLILSTFVTLSSSPIAFNTYDGSPALHAEPDEMAN